MPRSTTAPTGPVMMYPYADEDAQGNLRIVALPITVYPREWTGLSAADLLPGMVWRADA